MQLGDFSELAKNYVNRLAYDTELIRKIMEHRVVEISDIATDDVGAGTGKLTKVLAEIGCYTKNWEEILVSNGHFKGVRFIETSYLEHMSKERYLGAWKSVNDIRAQAGEDKFKLILDKIERKLDGMDFIDVPYKMRSWTAGKVYANIL